MSLDALDPGDNDEFPNVPRTPAGWLDTERMPIGPRWQRGADGDRVLIDVTPSVRRRDGSVVPLTEVVPPPP